MRKGAQLARLAVIAALLLSPYVSLAQRSGGSIVGGPERQFGTIDSALVSAADTAFEAVTARATNATAIALPKHAQSDSVVPPRERTSPSGDARNEGLDALVQPILVREGVPKQLAAVIQVESGGNPLALSPKGARGLWQLMPDTARRYGLTVNDHLDERVDLEKSTTSAARYLRDLYMQFGSWPLALAAYNTGEQNLQRAIDRARSRDFPTLSMMGYLPSETRNYVPSVFAAMGRQFPSAVPPAEYRQPARFVYATVEGAGQ